MKYKVIALIGKSGSGKDTLMTCALRADTNNILNEIVSCTSRPPRQGEVDGVNYHFLKDEDFDITSDFLEVSFFNNWYYGTKIKGCLDKDRVNIGVFNPDGIKSMMKRQDIIDLQIFYVMTDSKTRLLRQLNREDDPDVDEIIRRYNADERDFHASNLTFPMKIIWNTNEIDLITGTSVLITAAKNF